MPVNLEYINVRDATRLVGTIDAGRISGALRSGELAVLPTETGYMLAAAVSQPAAVDAAFAAKKRDRGNVMHIACSSLEMARRYAVLDDQAERLIGAFTPGPLSVIVSQTDQLPSELVTRDGTVGIRIPDSPATLQIIAATGVPLTATSVNLSGATPAGGELEGLEELSWIQGSTVCVVVDPDAVTYPQASTLVRLTNGYLEVLRTGPVTIEEMRDVLGR